MPCPDKHTQFFHKQNNAKNTPENTQNKTFIWFTTIK